MITGDRVRLRGVERADLASFQAWLNDPEVTHGMQLYRPLSMEEEIAWFEGLSDRPQDERPLAIEARVADGWELVGNCGLFGIDWRVRSAELGIFIGVKERWNQGYGTEATHLLVQHSFEALNLNRVFLRVYADNPRAVRAYEKAGFVVEGRLRQAEYHAGAYVDVLIMSVLRSDWGAG